jgi:hypothetical protein
MKKTGTLTLNSGFSRLSGTRLLKGAKNSDGFDRATIFVRDVRHLKNKQKIFVEGEDDVFGQNVPIIIITDAGPAEGVEAVALEGAVSERRPRKPGRSKKAARKSGKKSTKKSAKKSAKKRSSKKATKKSSRKKAARKK